VRLWKAVAIVLLLIFSGSIVSILATGLTIFSPTSYDVEIEADLDTFAWKSSAVWKNWYVLFATIDEEEFTYQPTEHNRKEMLNFYAATETFGGATHIGTFATLERFYPSSGIVLPSFGPLQAGEFFDPELLTRGIDSLWEFAREEWGNLFSFVSDRKVRGEVWFNGIVWVNYEVSVETYKLDTSPGEVREEKKDRGYLTVSDFVDDIKYTERTPFPRDFWGPKDSPSPPPIYFEIRSTVRLKESLLSRIPGLDLLPRDNAHITVRGVWLSEELKSGALPSGLPSQFQSGFLNKLLEMGKNAVYVKVEVADWDEVFDTRELGIQMGPFWMGTGVSYPTGKLNIPDTYLDFQLDHWLDERETDTIHLRLRFWFSNEEKLDFPSRVNVYVSIPIMFQVRLVSVYELPDPAEELQELAENVKGLIEETLGVDLDEALRQAQENIEMLENLIEEMQKVVPIPAPLDNLLGGLEVEFPVIDNFDEVLEEFYDYVPVEIEYEVPTLELDNELYIGSAVVAKPVLTYTPPLPPPGVSTYLYSIPPDISFQPYFPVYETSPAVLFARDIAVGVVIALAGVGIAVWVTRR